MDPRFSEIEGHRPYLVRYALAQLRDRTLAEEAVQEALLAALESIGTFGGKSSLRTWLTSILRFKVIDLQRRAMAERTHEQYDEGTHSEDDGWLDEIFDSAGHWRAAAVLGQPPGGARAAAVLGGLRLALRACLEKNWFRKEAGGR